MLIAFCHRMTIFHLIILTFYPEYMARSVQFNETVLFASFVLFCFALSRFSVSCASYKTPGCIGIGKMACISRITNAYKPHCRLNTLLPFLLLKPNVRTQKHTYTRRILYFSFCVRCYNGALSVHCRVFLQLYVDCTAPMVLFRFFASIFFICAGNCTFCWIVNGIAETRHNKRLKIVLFCAHFAPCTLYIEETYEMGQNMYE